VQIYIRTKIRLSCVKHSTVQSCLPASSDMSPQSSV